IDSPLVEERKRACRELAELGADAESAVPALLGALKDSASDVRHEAARALAAIGNVAGLADHLAKALKDEAPGVRMWSAIDLRRIGQDAKPAFVQLLESLAGETDPDVLDRIGSAICEIGCPLYQDMEAAVAKLRPALIHEDEKVRYYASVAASNCARF